MRASTASKKASARRGRSRQVNVRVEPGFYQALESVARTERRSVPQTARHLMEEGLQQRLGARPAMDDTASSEIGRLAVAGHAFAWLADEPDLYDDTSGEPV